MTRNRQKRIGVPARDKVMFSIRVTKEFRRGLKMYSAREGVSMTKLVERACARCWLRFEGN